MLRKWDKKLRRDFCKRISVEISVNFPATYQAQSLKYVEDPCFIKKKKIASNFKKQKKEKCELLKRFLKLTTDLQRNLQCQI